MLNERLQILVRPDQRQRLESEARRRGTSVAALVREAVDRQFGGGSAADRLAAVRAIAAMGGKFLPVDDLNRLIDNERDDVLQVPVRTRR